MTKPAAIASPHSAKTASSDVKTDPFRGLSLTSVLLNCDTKSVNFVDFAEKLKIIVRALFNEDESLLMLVQEIGGSFCVTKAVFKKYLDSWARHKTSFGGQGALGYTANNDDSASLMMPFDADIDEKAEKNAECSRLNRYKFEMGWFLYLRTKKALNIAGTDLAQSYYIMIASFVFLLEHAYNNDNENSESSQSSNNLTDMQEGPVAAALIALRKPSDKSSSGGILLESVARENNLSPAHVSKVRAMLRHVENAVTNIIEEVRTREARVASSNGDGIDSAGVKEVSDDEVRLDEASTGQQYKSIFSSERLQTIVRILKSEFQHISMKSLLFLDELWVLGNNSRQGQVMGVPLVSNSIKSTESGPPVRPTTPPAHSRSTFSLQDAGDASAHMDSAHSGRPPRSPYSSSSVRASHAPSTSGGSAPLVGMFGGSMPSSPYGLFSTPGGASTPTSSVLGGAATALRSSPAQTPITSAMESSQWLYQLNQLSADPGPTMEKYFVDAGIISTMQSNLRNDIVARPERLLSKLDAPGHEEVRVQSRALYWRALVQLLDKESARLGVTAHSNLLGSESFHKALLSCATETVLKANSLITLTFPKILETFNISAIDFFKVLESFVSVTHNLPTALRRHLNRVHEMILEQYAWVSNSPLFAMIHKQKEQNLWPIDSLAPPTSLSEDDDAAIAPPAAGGRPSGDKSLVMLFDKLLALCSVLIYDLSHALGEQLLEDLPLTCSIDGKATGPCVKDQIYATLKACLADHHYTLCRNRSILHIVLCTFYGVCKVNKLQHEVKFQVIIQTYKELLRGSSAENIVHQIPLVDDVRGDIIQFYNTVYLPTMKQHLISVSFICHCVIFICFFQISYRRFPSIVIRFPRWH